MGLPSNPTENRNQASLKPTDRVIVKPCTYFIVAQCVAERRGLVAASERAETAGVVAEALEDDTFDASDGLVGQFRV